MPADNPFPSNIDEILTDDLTDTTERVVARELYDMEFSVDHRTRTFINERTRSAGDAKNIYEFYELVRQAVRNMESRAGRRVQDAIRLTEEEPDFDSINETITISLISRQPGVYGDGPPGQKGQSAVRTYKEVLINEMDDPQYTGYRQRVSGLFIDNIVRFTCWARNNKTVNDRALWFERLLKEYDWWFKLSGVERVIWMGQGTNITQEANKQKWYGRPIDVFVRTQQIRTFRERALHEILLNFDTFNSDDSL